LVAAEKYMRAAIETLHSLNEKQAQIVKDCVLLKGWLEDQGEHEKAVEVHQQRMALLFTLDE
jgi:hypothetical protein